MDKTPVKGRRNSSPLQTPQPSPTPQDLPSIPYNSPPSLGSSQNSQKSIISVSSSPYQMAGNIPPTPPIRLPGSGPRIIVPFVSPSTSQGVNPQQQQQKVVVIQRSTPGTPASGSGRGKGGATPSRSRKTAHVQVQDDEVQILADKGLPPNSGRRGGARSQRLDSLISTGSEMSENDIRLMKTRENERKRRQAQKDSADKLRDLVPGLIDGKNRKAGEGVVMQKAGEYIDQLIARLAEAEQKVKERDERITEAEEEIKKLTESLGKINRTAHNLIQLGLRNLTPHIYLYCRMKHLESLKPDAERLQDIELLKPVFLNNPKTLAEIYRCRIPPILEKDPLKNETHQQINSFYKEFKETRGAYSGYVPNPNASFVPTQASSGAGTPTTAPTTPQQAVPRQMTPQQLVLPMPPQRMRDQIRITTIPSEVVVPNPAHQARLGQIGGVIRGAPGGNVKLYGMNHMVNSTVIRLTSPGQQGIFTRMPDGSVRMIIQNAALAQQLFSATTPEERITTQLGLMSVKQDNQEDESMQETESQGKDVTDSEPLTGNSVPGPRVEEAQEVNLQHIKSEPVEQEEEEEEEMEQEENDPEPVDLSRAKEEPVDDDDYGYSLEKVKQEPHDEQDYSLEQVKQEPDDDYEYSLDKVKQEMPNDENESSLANANQEPQQPGFSGYLTNSVQTEDSHLTREASGNGSPRNEVPGDEDGAVGGVPRMSGWVLRDAPPPPSSDSSDDDDEDGAAGGAVSRMGQRHPVERALQEQALARDRDGSSSNVKEVNMLTLRSDHMHISRHPLFGHDFHRLSSREKDMQRLYEICRETWKEIQQKRKEKDSLEAKKVRPEKKSMFSVVEEDDDEYEDVDSNDEEWNSRGKRSKRGRRSAGRGGGRRGGGRADSSRKKKKK